MIVLKMWSGSCRSCGFCWVNQKTCTCTCPQTPYEPCSSWLTWSGNCGGLACLGKRKGCRSASVPCNSVMVSGGAYVHEPVDVDGSSVSWRRLFGSAGVTGTWDGSECCCWMSGMIWRTKNWWRTCDVPYEHYFA